MHKIFVDAKVITAGGFRPMLARAGSVNTSPRRRRAVYPGPGRQRNFAGGKVVETFATNRVGAYLPLQNYDIDIDLARSFPAETCQRWCVLPFDRMSKSILVATANPFNQQAAKELAAATPTGCFGTLVPPARAGEKRSAKLLNRLT